MIRRSFAALIVSCCLLLAQASAFAAPAKTPAPKAPASKAPAKPKASTKFMDMARKGTPLYATFVTNKGQFVAKLFSKDAPETVSNFVGLATGEKTWTAPDGKKTNKPLYNGTIFHRVIPNFMIQGGDPEGRGTGGPGYQFKDEFQSGRTFNKVGLLAMANRGPGTNGSQFFVTTSTPQHLNNKHTIFGEVTSGYNVVEAISNSETGANDKPVQKVVIEKIIISATAPKAAPAKPAAPRSPKKK